MKEHYGLDLQTIQFALRDYLQAHPDISMDKSISAELQIINSLLKRQQLADNAEIILVHSATPEGQYAVEMIALTLKLISNSLAVKLIQIENLGMESNDLTEIQQGMSSLINELSELFEHYLPYRDHVIFAPIGGYKSMAMLSHIVASTFQFESWYQFEGAHFPINIPSIPVTLDATNLLNEENKKGFQQFYLENGFSFKRTVLMSKLPSHVRRFINDHPPFFYRLEDEDDSLISISPLIMRQINAHEEEFLPTFYFSKDIESLQKYEVYKKFVIAWPTGKSPEDFKYTFEHEYDLGLGGKENHWHVFRAKRGDSLRAIYYLDREQSTIYIKKVMTHQKYDRLLSNTKHKQSFKKLLTEGIKVNRTDYEEYLKEK